MNIDQANSIPLSVILANLGYKPTKENEKEAWYISPWRKEKTASFKVNKQTNEWYDHGEGKGGDVVNFGCVFLASERQDCTPHDALRWVTIMSGSYAMIKPVLLPVDTKVKDTLQLICSREISKIGLINYLASRGISLEVAGQYLQQVVLKNKNTNKIFFALGFLNEDGGYEIRNKIFKGSLKPKTITFIKSKKEGKPDTLHIFEGFMDFLTILQIQPDRLKDADVIVLNSLSNLQRATPYIDKYGYSIVYSWMDNNPAGEKATNHLAAFLQTQEALTHKPMNSEYSGHVDVNAWHMHNLGL